jgi:hypothetical protein
VGNSEGDIMSHEQQILDIVTKIDNTSLDPVEGIKKLIDITFEIGGSNYGPLFKTDDIQPSLKRVIKQWGWMLLDFSGDSYDESITWVSDDEMVRMRAEITEHKRILLLAMNK